MHGGMKSYALAQRLPGPLAAPAELQQMVQSGIQSVGVAVLEGKIGSRAKTGLVIQEVGIERAEHETVHGLANEIEGVRLQQGLEKAAVFLLALL